MQGVVYSHVFSSNACFHVGLFSGVCRGEEEEEVIERSDKIKR